MVLPYNVAVGDVVEMRKLHPCGGKVWAVTRIGADIGIKCQKCGRHVMLARRDYFKGVRVVSSRGVPQEARNVERDDELPG